MATNTDKIARESPEYEYNAPVQGEEYELFMDIPNISGKCLKSEALVSSEIDGRRKVKISVEIEAEVDTETGKHIEELGGEAFLVQLFQQFILHNVLSTDFMDRIIPNKLLNDEYDMIMAAYGTWWRGQEHLVRLLYQYENEGIA